ncbi:LysR family transcriptional regulator [Spirochaeta isovalerica]|uniref:DNA-binding transcriptional LysR family regulator n=1 Tax=Spirochaeta isovalerica TaxID=150 RepID=A0A841RFL6_9SPIO|nr:LysR family transcriptional regulator [Spirochaeta isovalerica]MBB6482181.1 DNA-binding transcriptional LysR family regulator [Spirochaeta isovalerica]
MDLNKLKTFYTVAQLNNFSRAAEILYLTQPAVSAQIKDLEFEYKTKLFNRNGRKIELTDSGEKLIPFVKKLLDIYDDSLHAISLLQEAGQGSIKLGVSGLPGARLLPAALSRFREIYPDIHISIREKKSAGVLDLLKLKKFDLGLIVSSEENINTSIIGAEVLYRDKYVVGVSYDNPLARKKSIGVKDLSQNPLIVSPKDTVTHQAIIDLYNRLSLPLNIEYEIENKSMMKTMVEKNLGIAFFSSLEIKKEVESQLICPLELEGIPFYSYIQLAYNKTKELNPASKAFHDFIFNIDEQDNFISG